MQVDLAGPAGRLEALIEVPDAPRFAMVVCHPHPQYGGTMHTHAVYRIARAARSRGGITLRFNFRGVGRSAGSHDEGRGEQDDVRTALAHLAADFPELPRYVAGFSFGAWMALEVACVEEAVRAVLCAGLALHLRGVAVEVASTCAKPVAVVQAERDQFGTPDEVLEALIDSRGPRHVAMVKHATHLFTEDLDGLERESEKAIDWLLAGGRPR
ncbi:MAG TPA: alpha/beta family hydrolase [Anaeromyxobacteraceae bacterium]|nr:alpha/beta family hydrolase [Anaeromyxobacteraceae bacterium]